MGILGKLFGGSKEEENKNFLYISEIAGLISSEDPQVMNNIKMCLDNPGKYSASFADHGLEPNDKNFYWISMRDELENAGYLFSVDYKCELEDFLWALSQLKTYRLIDIDLSSLNLDENEDAEAWGEEINHALGGRAFVCAVDIDSDSYELIIVGADVCETVSDIARKYGHFIEEF